MDSSSSRNSDQSTRAFREGGPGFVCLCKLPVVVRISHSTTNPTRRYLWCPKPSGLRCDYFWWLDPPNPRYLGGSPPEVETEIERQKRFLWIRKCARLEQDITQFECKSKEFEMKICDLKFEKKKMKKDLIIWRCVVCCLVVLLVAMKLG